MIDLIFGKVDWWKLSYPIYDQSSPWPSYYKVLLHTTKCKADPPSQDINDQTLVHILGHSSLELW